uniref:Uncharacterized protein n=1 Tax=Panagrolaimus davidi TaxID=227884 RepID=A0A914PK38_9BILA
MHLAAVNLILAFQFIFEKGVSNQESLIKVYKKNKAATYYILPSTATTTTTSIFDVSSNSSEESNENINSTLIRIARAAASEIITGNSSIVEEDCGPKIECILGNTT